MFVYYKTLAKPAMQYQCGMPAAPVAAPGAAARNGNADLLASAAASAAAAAAAAAGSHFVSAVCWQPNTGRLVAANSQGGMWVLAMGD